MGKYEEALERARAGKPIDEVFLELKESEDERVRKAALEGIEYLEHKLGWDFIGDTDILNVKEYLERQKEQPMSAEEVLIRAGLKPYRDGNQWCVLAGGNIQEGICGFGDTIDEALYQFLMEVIKIQKEQKPLSTEETERNSIAFLEQLGYTCIPPGAEQKPAEWSEEDERLLSKLELYVDMECFDRECNGEDLRNWLKSLRPRPHWKPSEEHPEGGCSEKPNDLLSEPEAEKRITITLSSFDIKLIYDALERERNERLSKTPWKNRNPQGYPPQYSHDYNAKSVRQVDSTLRFIKRQIEQMNARKEK